MSGGILSGNPDKFCSANQTAICSVKIAAVLDVSQEQNAV
jgi:hypothetical protein